MNNRESMMLFNVLYAQKRMHDSTKVCKTNRQQADIKPHCFKNLLFKKL